MLDCNEMGAFARHAYECHDLNIAAIPTGGEDGKRPLVRGFTQRVIGPDEIDRLSIKYPTANIGLVPQFSGFIAVDIDSTCNVLQRDIECRFGKGPVKAMTGSGHMHLLYRKSRYKRQRIASVDLRKDEDIPVEIKADGTFIVGPGSMNPKTGGYYRFLDGKKYEDLLTGPEFDPISIQAHLRDVNGRNAQRVSVGHRNNALLRQCLRDAPYCDDFDDLLDCALSFNADFPESLPDKEVEKTVRKAWRYQLNDDNWVGKEAQTPVPSSLVNQIADDCGANDCGDALALLVILRNAHLVRQRRGEAFCLVFTAMAREQTIPGWSAHRFEKSAKALLAGGFIVCVRRGKGRGNPSLYQLAEKTLNISLRDGAVPAARAERWVA
ncbi:MAG: bifunctional DNA primase/polymerase [Hyphomicrobiaceae bacterium]